MDIYDSMKKIKESNNSDSLEKYSKLSIKFAEQGFDEKGISDLLRYEGCSKEESKKLAKSALDEVPYKFYILDPPDCFDDISDQVENGIKKASIEDIEKYFDKHQNKKFENVKNNILIAKSNGSERYFKEAAHSLKPLVEDLIIAGKALSSQERQEDFLDEKEKLEQNIFGVWPVFLIQKRAQIDKADKKLIDKSAVKPGDNISFI